MFFLSAHKKFQMRKSKNEDLGNGSHCWNNPKSTKTAYSIHPFCNTSRTWETFQLTSQFLYSLGSRWCNEDSGLVKLWWIMERTPLLMFKMYSGSSSLQKIWPTFPSLYSNLSGRSSNGFSSLETGETVCDSDWSKDVTFTSYRIGFLNYKEKKNLNNLI